MLDPSALRPAAGGGSSKLAKAPAATSKAPTATSKPPAATSAAPPATQPAVPGAASQAAGGSGGAAAGGIASSSGPGDALFRRLCLLLDLAWPDGTGRANAVRKTLALALLRCAHDKYGRFLRFKHGAAAGAAGAPGAEAPAAPLVAAMAPELRAIGIEVPPLEGFLAGDPVFSWRAGGQGGEGGEVEVVGLRFGALLDGERVVFWLGREAKGEERGGKVSSSLPVRSRTSTPQPFSHLPILQPPPHHPPSRHGQRPPGRCQHVAQRPRPRPPARRAHQGGRRARLRGRRPRDGRAHPAAAARQG